MFTTSWFCTLLFAFTIGFQELLLMFKRSIGTRNAQSFLSFKMISEMPSHISKFGSGFLSKLKLSCFIKGKVWRNRYQVAWFIIDMLKRMLFIQKFLIRTIIFKIWSSFIFFMTITWFKCTKIFLILSFYRKMSKPNR